MADENTNVNGTALEVPYPVPEVPTADDHIEAVKVNQPANGFTVDIPDDNKVKPVPNTGITFTKSKIAVAVGNDIYANVNFAPDYTGNKALTWKSSDETVATIAKDGKITGLKDGVVTITATSADSKTATTELTVGKGNPNVAVTGVTLNKTTTSLAVGATETLTATVAPANATNKKVTWKSSDATKATVDATGKITAVAEGTATITVTTEDGAKTATCAVTVTAAA